MNNLNIQQTGGFPLETDTLNFMQEAYTLFNTFGNLAGDLTILKGCDLVGNVTIADGVVYIKGELLPFRGGTLGSHVIIREETTTRVFEDGNEKPVYLRRYATFGSATTAYAWGDFNRVHNLIELKNLLDQLNTKTVPVGAINMWAGALDELPTGWVLCNGQNGTPDLRGKFIVGHDSANPDYNAIGKQGGSEQTTPSGAISSTTLRLKVPRDGWGTTGSGMGSAASGRLLVGSGISEYGESLESIRAAGADKYTAGHTHGHSFTGESSENRPPYFTLAYIQFKGI